MTTRVITPDNRAGLHPMVDRVIRVLERNVEAFTPWDSITVEDRPTSSGGKTRTFYTIRAERHPGTLAATTVQVHVRESGPFRGRFVGGTVFVTFGKDRRIDTWSELRSRGY